MIRRALIAATVAALTLGAVAGTRYYSMPPMMRRAPAASATSTPVFAADLRAMWTFSSSDWTNANYGSGALTRSAGAATWDGSGAVTLTGATSYAVSPVTRMPTNSGTIAVRYTCTNSAANPYLYWWGTAFNDSDIRLRLVNGNADSYGYSGTTERWYLSATGATTSTSVILTTWTTNGTGSAAHYIKRGTAAPVQVGTDASVAIAWSPSGAYIFAYNSAGGFGFAGSVDEVRIYGSNYTSNDCLSIIADMPWTAP